KSLISKDSYQPHLFMPAKIKTVNFHGRKNYNKIMKLSRKILFLSSEERRIKKLLHEEIKAFESEDLENLMSGVSYNYRDEYGFNYLYLKEFFKKFFMVYSDLKVEYENLKIDISEDKAKVEMDVRIIGTSEEKETGYIAGDIKTPLHFIFTLEKTRFRWLVLKTEISNLN
ncbi:MAG: hypothetical protein N2257_10830, partial [Thermodesulfovibrionales bacterium]|nr:hypothetical protein [Thermodesulfovibrionales bacterium]